MSEKELDSGNFNEEINNTEKLVLVDFYATWCGPCKMLAPVVSEIAEEYKEKLEVYKVNIDENQELALKYDIVKFEYAFCLPFLVPECATLYVICSLLSLAPFAVSKVTNPLSV